MILIIEQIGAPPPGDSDRHVHSSKSIADPESVACLQLLPVPTSLTKCQITVAYLHTLMSLLLSNWVERRAAKERHLRNAIDLWKKAQEVIAEACQSLNHHYADVATLQRIKQDSNLVLLT